MATVNNQTKRIIRDLEFLEQNPLDFVRDLRFTPGERQNVLRGVMIGPKESPYADGHFHFVITFPPQYPFVPPEFNYVTRICHPNILSTVGTACHDQLMATWAPSIALPKYLTDMHHLLENPSYEMPVAEDPLTVKTSEKAYEWTQKFAKGSAAQ